MEDQILTYHKFLEKLGFRLCTVQKFKSFIDEYAVILGSPIEKASKTKVLNYMNKMLNNAGYSNNKKGRFVKAFDTYFNLYLNRNFKMCFNVPKYVDSKTPLIFTYIELLLIFNLTKILKFKTVFGLMYMLGLKPSEITCIKNEHYNAYHKFIIIIDKQGISKKLNVPDSLVKLLAIYQKRHTTKIYMFEYKAKQHKNERSFENYFNQILRVSGIIKHVTLETLRNTYIAHQLQCGTDRNKLKYLLGLHSMRLINKSQNDFKLEDPCVFTNGIDLLNYEEEI